MRPSSRRTRRAVVGGLSTVIAVLAMAAPASAFAFGFGSGPRNVTCDLLLHALIPQPAPTAANAGVVSCDNGIGRGLQRDASTKTPPGPVLAGSFTGPFTMYFRDGTILGTFTINFVTTLGGTPLHIVGVNYNGTVTVTGGTGDYRRVSGGGTVTGFSADAVDTHLTEKLTLTGL